MGEAHNTGFIVELDDGKDIDNVKCLLDPYLPPFIAILNTQFDLLRYDWSSVDLDSVTFIHRAHRFYFDERDEATINSAFHKQMHQAYTDLAKFIYSKGLTPAVAISLRVLLFTHNSS